MQIPVTVSFRHMHPSSAVEARARAPTVRLDRYYERITGCHVVIEAPPAHAHDLRARADGAPGPGRPELISP
jgi:hypothetical protein